MRAARAFAEARNWRRALTQLEQVLARHPDHAPAHYLIGAYRDCLGEHDAAIEACREAVRLAPEDNVAHRLLCLVLSRRRRSHGEAQDHGNQALRLAPEEAWNHFTLGELKIAMSQPRAALSAFEKAVSLAPNDASLLAFCAERCFVLGRNEEASAYAGRAYRADPGDLRAITAAARAQMTKGRTREALDLTRAAIALDASDSKALAVLFEAEACRSPIYAAWRRLRNWTKRSRIRAVLIWLLASAVLSMLTAVSLAVSDSGPLVVIGIWIGLVALVLVPEIRAKRRAAAAGKTVRLKSGF